MPSLSPYHDYLDPLPLKTRGKAYDYEIDCQITPRQNHSRPTREIAWKLGHHSASRALKQSRYAELSPNYIKPVTSACRKHRTPPSSATFCPKPSYRSPAFRPGNGKRNSHSTPMRKRNISSLQQVSDDIFTYKAHKIDKQSLPHHLFSPKNNSLLKFPQLFHKTVNRKPEQTRTQSPFQRARDNGPSNPFFGVERASPRQKQRKTSPANTLWSHFQAGNSMQEDISRETRHRKSTEWRGVVNWEGVSTERHEYHGRDPFLASRVWLTCMYTRKYLLEREYSSFR